MEGATFGVPAVVPAWEWSPNAAGAIRDGGDVCLLGRVWRSRFGSEDVEGDVYLRKPRLANCFAKISGQRVRTQKTANPASGTMNAKRKWKGRSQAVSHTSQTSCSRVSNTPSVAIPNPCMQQRSNWPHASYEAQPRDVDVMGSNRVPETRKWTGRNSQGCRLSMMPRHDKHCGCKAGE